MMRKDTWIVQNSHHESERHADDGEKPYRRTYGQSGLPVVLCAGGYAYQHSRAGCEPEDDARDGLHHLTSDGHTGHARRVVKLSDHKQVRPSVQGLQHIGYQIRDGELHQHFRHTSFREIQFLHVRVPYNFGGHRPPDASF